MQKPLISSKHLHEKLVQPENDLENDVGVSEPVEIAAAVEEAEPMASIDLAKSDSELLVNETNGASSKSMKKDIKRNKRLEKKQLKQQQKQQQKLTKKAKKQNNERNNNNEDNRAEALQSNLKSRSPVEPAVPRAKSKSPVNVTFAFDTIDESNKDIVDNHSECNAKGQYDSLPMIKVDKSADDVTKSNNDQIDGNGNVVPAAAAAAPLISRSSSDSIPFIDDSPNPRRAVSIPIETHKNFHDGRFITLHPRNIGAQSMIYARKLEKPLPIAFKIPAKRDQFDKSAHILYQSLKESIDHHFERAAQLHNKLCQVCHEFLLVPEAVKCLTCGIVCHQSCTLPQVSFNRYFNPHILWILHGIRPDSELDEQRRVFEAGKNKIWNENSKENSLKWFKTNKTAGDENSTQTLSSKADPEMCLGYNCSIYHEWCR